MRLVVKADDSAEARLVSRIFREEAGNITAFSVVELVLGDSDEVAITDAHARICVDMRSDFIREADEKAVRFIVAQKIFLANVKRLEIGEPVIEEIAANRMLARAGYEDALVYYYYSLISRLGKNLGFEEFMLLNIPWLSLSGVDNYDAEVFLKIKKKFSYKSRYEEASRELFELLKGEIRGPAAAKAVKLYRGLYASNQV